MIPKFESFNSNEIKNIEDCFLDLIDVGSWEMKLDPIKNHPTYDHILIISNKNMFTNTGPMNDQTSVFDQWKFKIDQESIMKLCVDRFISYNNLHIYSVVEEDVNGYRMFKNYVFYLKQL